MAARTQFAYDANGVLLSETNPLGHAYQLGHDPLGALKTVTDPLGKVTGYSWNGSNQLLTQTDANSHTTRYGYDSAGLRRGTHLAGRQERRPGLRQRRPPGISIKP